jgi:hypothetical protein
LPGDHGFDSVGRIGENIAVGEAKYVGDDEVFKIGKLGSRSSTAIQMDDKWIGEVLDEMIDAGQVKLAQEIKRHRDSGTLQKYLVITRESGQIGGVSDEVLNMFHKIVEVDTFGNTLKIYTR